MDTVARGLHPKDLPTTPPDSTPPPDDVDPAPPAYHPFEPSSSGSIRSHPQTPPPLQSHRSTRSLAQSPSSSPGPNPVTTTETSPRSKKSKGKSRGNPQDNEDVKKMVYKSVEDAVKDPGSQQSVALIEKCAELCREKGLNFSGILQDPCLGRHRALYWVIVGKPPPNEYGLLSAILKHSGSLYPSSINEARLACLQVSDQTLFNHLWRHPAYSGPSVTNEFVFGATGPADRVEVQEATANEIPTFIARFEIPHFHKRMGISGKIAFEFIARGRLWCLKFYSTDKNTTTLVSWAISLTMINPSPPTWLNSRIVILEQGKKLPPWPSPKGSAVDSPSPASPEEKNILQFQLQTKKNQLEFPPSWKTKVGRTELVAKSSDDPASASLQFADSPYYSPDGCLQVIMEAQLARAEAEKSWLHNILAGRANSHRPPAVEAAS